MSLLKGSVIDFATELIGSSFRIAENPQVSKACFDVPSHAANFRTSPKAMAVAVELAGSSRYDIYYPTSRIQEEYMLYITFPRRIIDIYHSATLMSFARQRQSTYSSYVLSRQR